MRATESGGKVFDPCPEYAGRAVCVDSIPLEMQPGAFGMKEITRFVFEVDVPREDGTRFCVWSRPFTLGLSEKSNLRKFLELWLARPLTEIEKKDGFELDEMIGKPAFIVVVHAQEGDKTYANIASCTPDKTGNPLKPSGKFIRKQDREMKPGHFQSPSVAVPAQAPAPAPVKPQTPASIVGDGDEYLGSTRIHIPGYVGLQVRDLTPDQAQIIADSWIPKARAAKLLSPESARLLKAMEWYLVTFPTGSIEVPF